ncbi:Acetyl/propionyl-CoA carboxylase, alpha subunit [Brevibacterium jeotgali]|uniref:acetyl-CoA carboxylase n=1 Tax=Brevibacterium jeotgali TaxID=1262550 RepID=A0A2H1L3U7_9MICO|nr:acetyl/propionyl-CoA carboxylase alpha subunit [Brevibacterium jeotgali]SMY11405.1 Acetyl/propionyl-CoA carboxylase, alpha subunit [Brevibacterium jeotgali]
MSTVLVANRGEIAVRIVDAVHAVGMTAAVIHTSDDDAHIRHADEAVLLNGVGASPYLEIDQVIGAALSSGAAYLHPGYGFLSENADLARACTEAGIVFIGPDADALDVFGDKAKARRLAESVAVPVVPGTGLSPTPAEAAEFLREHGSVMVKATAGGGGRGLRRVDDASDLPRVMDECSREAEHHFGSGDFFLEKFVSEPRHIEIQVIGDGTAYQHLGERDCSVQRRNQKIVEIAPSPSLTAELRSGMTDAALTIASAVGLTSLATVEFLVSGDEFYFMEVNPRLQVEHTVTEQVTGIDLVAAQLRVAQGAVLEDVGLAEPPAVHGSAVQVRVNAEALQADGTLTPSAGPVDDLVLPAGRYVRVDTALRGGGRISPRFDSLVAKVIGHSDSFLGAVDVTARALADLRIAPLQTNRTLLHAILIDETFRRCDVDTGYLEAALPSLVEHTLPDDHIEARQTESTTAAVPEGAVAITAKLTGVVISINAEVGDSVRSGTVLAVVESMKMEHPVTVDVGMTLAGILVSPGDTVDAGQTLAYGQAGADDSGADLGGGDRATGAGDWEQEIEEIRRRHEEAYKHGGAAKVARQHESGRLTARERIAALADEGSFDEIGPLAGYGEYDEDGNLLGVRPSNFLSGTGRIRGRRALLGVDDFSIRGGSGDAAVHQKQVFTEQLAGEMRVPMVRVLDGASGGGSVKKVLTAQAMYLPVNPGWDHVVDNMSRIPVVSVCAGPTVGLGAARFVMSHFGVMVQGIGQLFTAGPPVVKAATGEDLDKDGLGGEAVHRTNGTVERFVPDEETAFEVVRDFLSYLPSSVDELPPVAENSDPVDRSEESLAAAVPRNPRQIYAIEPILHAVFDHGSVFRFAEYGDGTYTALARLDGRPVGVVTADPSQGATLSREGAQAVERLVDICEAFHLPLVSLTDQAGMTIGLQAEKDATIRAGARAIAAIYQARIPQAEIILRRVYGVGGAGIVNRHRAVRSWAWPSGDWGSLPPQGGIEAAFRAELAAHDDPEKRLAEITHEMELVSSRFRTAETFSVQDIIDPRTTRRRLCEWVVDAYAVLPRLVGEPSFGVRP